MVHDFFMEGKIIIYSSAVQLHDSLAAFISLRTCITRLIVVCAVALLVCKEKGVITVLVTGLLERYPSTWNQILQHCTSETHRRVLRTVVDKRWKNHIGIELLFHLTQVRQRMTHRAA